MFFEHSKQYGNVPNEPVTQCYLGKITKLYKCCNLADKFIGYINNQDNDFVSYSLEEHFKSERAKGVWWEIYEVPCLVLSSKSLQIGVLVKYFNTKDKRLKLKGKGLQTVTDDIAGYVSSKIVASPSASDKFVSLESLITPRYELEPTIIMDNEKKLLPSSMPFIKRRTVTYGINYSWWEHMYEPPLLTNYCNLVSKINLGLAINYK